MYILYFEGEATIYNQRLVDKKLYYFQLCVALPVIGVYIFTQCHITGTISLEEEYFPLCIIIMFSHVTCSDQCNRRGDIGYSEQKL